MSNLTRKALIEKVQDAYKALGEANKLHGELTKDWQDLQQRKKDVYEQAQEIKQKTDKIAEEEPKLQNKIVSLNVEIKKKEGFLETIGEMIEGSLEDLIKELT